MSILTFLFYFLLLVLFIIGLIYYSIFTITLFIIFLFIYFFGSFFYPKEGAKKLNEWFKESSFFQGPYYSCGLENVYKFFHKFFTGSLGYFTNLYMKYNPYILAATMAATIAKSAMDAVNKSKTVAADAINKSKTVAADTMSKMSKMPTMPTMSKMPTMPTM